jgi:hypothetical protein
MMPTRLDNVVIALAARNVPQRLLNLLPVHKKALLAVEKSSRYEAHKAVSDSKGKIAKFDAAKAQLWAAYILSSKIALRHAAKEFKLQGLPQPVKVNLELDYFNKAVLDLRRSILSFDVSDDEKARRAGLAATTIANRAYTEAQLAAYRAVRDDSDVTVMKVWIANTMLRTAPCAYCMHLHGTAVNVESEFSAPSGLMVYADLMGPPAHINCRCRLVAKIVRDDIVRTL